MSDNISAIANTFAQFGQQLADRMLAAVQDENPELAELVALTVTELGEELTVAVMFPAGGEPRIELLAMNDYGHVRRISTIPLRAKADD